MPFLNIRLQDVLSDAVATTVYFTATSTTPVEDGTTLTVGKSAQVITNSIGELLLQSIEPGTYTINIGPHTFKGIVLPDDAATYELTALIP